MTDYAFDIAVLGKGAIVRIDEDSVARLDASGTKGRRVRFADLDRVRWYETRAGRFITRSLELHGRDGTAKITQSMPISAGPNDPRVAAYQEAVRSVLASLSTARPDLRVVIGQPPFLRWFLFVSFLAVVLILVFGISSVLDSRHASDLWWVTGAMGLGVLFGLVMAFRGRPWKEPESMESEQLARLLV